MITARFLGPLAGLIGGLAGAMRAPGTSFLGLLLTRLILLTHAAALCFLWGNR